MNATTTRFACLLALTLPAAAMAAIPATPPKPGPAHQLTTPKTVETTLANGLRVIVAQRDDLPLVTANLVVKSGSEVDPAALPGAMALMSTLLTRGTKERSAPQIAADAAALGGAVNASAGWDETDVSMTVTTPKLDAALDLVADVALHPTFKADELERARSQTLDGLRVVWRQPGALSGMIARRAVFGAGSYGHPSGGTPTSVKAITRAALVQLHATYFRPDNAVLVFAGDIAPKAAFALAQAKFGDWARPHTAMPKLPVAEGTPVAAKVLAVDLPHAGQTGVVVAHKAIARSADDYYAGLVTNAILGGSYSARLNEEVRIKRGLSYGANSGLSALRHGGWLHASAQTKNRSAAPVVDLVLKQFASLVEAPPAAHELAVRKATLIGGFGRSLETTGGLANQVVERAIYGVDPDEMGQFVSKVEAVTSDQVKAFAKAHLGAEAMRVVVVGDASVYAKAFAKAWPKARRVEVSDLNLSRADLGLKPITTPHTSAQH